MVNVTLPKTNYVIIKHLLRCGKMASLSGYNEYDMANEPESEKDYYYQLLDGLEVQQGDVVVVHNALGYTLGVVVEINALSSDPKVLGAKARVITKVDFSKWYQYLEDQKKLQSLKAAMEAKRQTMEKRAIYQQMAANDPEFAEMLKVYESLGGTFD